ncbi:MAG: NADH:ubiquinone reductase (Na(+)-transporting) subunit E [Cyclobacteriaceae bacterium]|jgi:Na+-transporting NADH:ubiquinone oxidoreductase subunit E|nr:NADH:ubiquinone reductase (Na(+)-transporting) subunit E [Cyclobacteriaceae bacterium]MDB4602917.1 NADH:ubiquinone reductase (Na(+)-transporting) subunit E [Cyclobacteriaceae bacterium]MDB4742329.1 NADH:ubiquinone reductase (Na(+)-transporting) subunit E [Cyclobacteriaceae bacterium]MDB9883695.1 NADH:ubiquinone reductase (Na(+)-transporting) subunit E [Cyclobacteriaceae bacterium]MDB9939042.1 NADH:ubiquinone reductase (Na(+)-transporting) subunit E [Cyclobacteriaceae bacterium]|tara:strand:- start:377 stop:988 length:612 start_codon:yes stop_codon:yes gene_type:complete
MEVFNIALRGIFIDNMIFAYYLGMCSFLAVSKKVETAFGLGLAVVFVLTLTVPVNWLLQEYVLKEGALTWIDGSFESIDLTFLQFIMFIAVIASMVQLVEMIIEKLSPALYGSLGIFLPLIAVNCAILGSSLFMVQKDYNIIEATSYGFGSGFGFFLAIIALAAIRERLKYSKVPPGLKGLGITMLITGLMGLAFKAFIGIAL